MEHKLKLNILPTYFGQILPTYFGQAQW